MPLRLPARTPSKYRAIPTQIDGIHFDSKKEARRYGELLMLMRAGEIRDLECQPEFPLFTARYKGSDVHQVGTYTADFRYRQGPTRTLIIEDVKSPATRKTAVYRLKKRMVEAAYGITVTEV